MMRAGVPRVRVVTIGAMHRRSLEGQVLVVTGASSGIGAATAVAAARAGMDLVIAARRADRLEAVAQRIVATGRRAKIVCIDVADPRASEVILGAAHDAFERLDAVFANAGIGIERPVVDATPEEDDLIWRVNFFASRDLLRAAARDMIERGRRGHLLMCSSCLGRIALPMSGAYCATKAAQLATCTAMRHELRGAGIMVSSVHPIGTETEFFRASAMLSGTVIPAQGRPPEIPRFLFQKADVVAKAVVRCLMRPRPEVWTSTSVRVAAGLMTIFPGLADRAIRRLADSLVERSPRP